MEQGEQVQCPGCGLVTNGATAGCQEMFDELLARDFSDRAYFRAHRMMVDTYCLQHPDRYCVSAKSFAAHLTGLCWAFEYGGHPPIGQALQRWLNGIVPLTTPALPASRGAVTIASVYEAADAGVYASAIEKWARSTWEAYCDLHALARRWVQEAMGRR